MAISVCKARCAFANPATTNCPVWPGGGQPGGKRRCYLALARFFRPGFAIKKSSRFLPALISRASHPAVPPLPLQVSPVLGCRYFGATFVPFTEPAFLPPPSPPI